MDLDSDSEDDNESELNDLRQLTAVLTADEASTNDTASQFSAPVASTSKSTTTSAQELRKIETALALNRLYEEKLQRLEKLLGTRLGECRRKLAQVQSQSTVLEKNDVFRYVSCGKPYFKDKSGFPAPDNQDALMARSEMYDFSQIISVPGWSVKDKSQFVTIILKMSRDLKKKELLSNIAALRRQKKDYPKKTIKKQVDVLEKEIASLANKSLGLVALPVDKEYDWETIANQLNRRHSAQEYQRLWKLYFHPSINKNSWSKVEIDRLQKIAIAHNMQDWDSIAAELNTGRTGYQCFVYFCTNMTTNSIGKKWSPEEISYLKRLIDYFREDNYIPWGKIAAAMENRTKIQIYNKYTRLFEVRKGRFLPEEDAVILNCVKRFGTDFRKMISFLPGRSRSQIRLRYNVISGMRISTVWTTSDDKKLLMIMSNLDYDDMSYAEAVKYFPGKTRSSLRTRHVTLLRWMKKNPYLDIEYAPRRGARRLNHGYANEDLNKALEDLKNTLNTKVSKSSKKRVTLDSPEVEIEDAIIAILINEKVQEEERNKISSEGDVMLNLANECVLQKELYVTNLRKSLIFLESRLNNDMFHASYYGEDYPALADPEQDVCLFRIKSYSKKKMVTSVKNNGCPNIFGDYPITNRNYVLPPHYATITGCRGLMAYVTKESKNAMSIYVIAKKNAVLKEQFNILLERFYILFLWPMLLSNEGPRNKHTPLVRSDKPQKTPLPESPEIAIPQWTKKFKGDEDGNGSIDLDEASNVTDNICIHPNLTDCEYSTGLSERDISALLLNVNAPQLRKTSK